MAHGVNITQIGSGTSDPNVAWDVEYWTTSESDYNKWRKRARFFTVVPDPLIPVPGGTLEYDGITQMEITRVWNMVRTTIDADFKEHHVFQVNAEILNSGSGTTAWELLEAETDN